MRTAIHLAATCAVPNASASALVGLNKSVAADRDLTDRPCLVALWIEYVDRIDEDARRLLPLRPVCFKAPVA